MSKLSFSQASLAATATVLDNGKHFTRLLSFADGHQKTLGLIVGQGIDVAEGKVSLTFDSDVAERFEVTEGELCVQMGDDTQCYRAGQSFVVAGGKSLTLSADGIVQYVRHFEG